MQIEEERQKVIRNYRDLTRLEMEQVDRENTIVWIPIGALEQHGSQAPLGTDDFIAESITKRVVERLDNECPDFPMLIFPLVPFGLSTEHKNFCGSIALKPDTLYHLLYDVCASLNHHGFKKVIIEISHGGNTPIVQVLSREIKSDLGMMVAYINTGAYFGNPEVIETISEGNTWDFHGGEMETSMVMADHPELVHLEASEEGKPTAFENNKHFKVGGAVTFGWTSEVWKTKDGKPIGIGGNPAGATADKGHIILNSMVNSIIPALYELRDFKDC